MGAGSLAQGRAPRTLRNGFGLLQGGRISPAQREGFGQERDLGTVLSGLGDELQGAANVVPAVPGLNAHLDQAEAGGGRFQI